MRSSKLPVSVSDTPDSLSSRRKQGRDVGAMPSLKFANLATFNSEPQLPGVTIC